MINGIRGNPWRSQWDDDNDGESNLDELIAGTNPDGDNLPQPVQVSLEVLPNKKFHINWEATSDAESYTVLENPDGVSGFTNISGQLAPGTTGFEHNVALYSRVNAKYLVQSCSENRCVDSAPVMVTGTLDNAIGYFKASNPGYLDKFGTAVSISADGNTLAVGAPGEDSNSTGVNADQNDDADSPGAAYIFVRNGGLWQQQAFLKASNADFADAFGDSISLSGDGNTLVVGASKEDSAATGVNGVEGDNSAQLSGAVYVFVRLGEVWHQQAYLKASNTVGDERFSQSVSLSADGNTLAVGAYRESSASTGVNGEQNDDSALHSGAVYVFVRSGVLWQQQAYLKASNTDAYDRFGTVLSLSGDGNTLVVGAQGEDSAATGITDVDQFDNEALGSGAVYVFVRSGVLWTQQAYLKASNAEAEEWFGFSVSLSTSGDTLAVGAQTEDSATTGINSDQNNNDARYSGAVYVFVRSGLLWQQQAYIKAGNTDQTDLFGRVSLSGDGNTLAVGAHGEDSAATGLDSDQNDNSANETGAVYVYVRNGSLWRQQAYVKASNTGAGDWFGYSLSLSSDGETLAVGARNEDGAAAGINREQSDDLLDDAGAVYVY